MTGPTATREALEVAFPFLTGATPALWRDLLEVGRRIRLEAGTSIAMQGSECPLLPLVLEGVVRVYRDDGEGRQITLYRIERGESCVLTASCSFGGGSFPASVVAETAVDAYAVPTSSAVAWLGLDAAWRAGGAS